MDQAYCSNCGHQLAEDARFCPSCGTPRARPGAETVVDEPASPSARPSAPDGPGADSAEPPPPDAETVRLAPRSPRSEAETSQLDVEPSVTQRPYPDLGSERTSTDSPPEAAKPEPDPTTPPAAGSAEAAELARRLAAQVRRPLVASALLGGVLGAGACAAVGVVLALVFDEQESFIGSLGNDADLPTEALRQAVGFLQVSFGHLPLPSAPSSVDISGRVTPLLLLGVPVGACALAAAAGLSRSRLASLRGRIASTAGLVGTFAVLMLLFALLSGDADPSVAGAFFAALLWGGLGALSGAAVVARREGRARGRPRAGALGPVGAAAGAAVRPLVLLLLVCGVLGTGAWIADVLTDADAKNTGRDVAEVALFGADHAVHFAELGGLVPFAATPADAGTVGLPAPTAHSDVVSNGKSFRVFAYDDALPGYLFVPGLIVLLALPLLFALFAGFAAANAARAAGGTGPPALAAAWGATVGPVWAIGLAVLDPLATKTLSSEGLGASATRHLFGTAEGAGAFALFLLVGTVLGALGGLLAAGSAPPTKA